MGELNGSHVHYVVQDGREAVHGECRPAFIVQDWGNTRSTLAEGGAVNLIVLRDGDNDLPGRTPVQWETSRYHSTGHEFATWHFLDECRGPQAATVGAAELGASETPPEGHDG